MLVRGGPDGTSPILIRRGEVVVYSAYVNVRRKNIWTRTNSLLTDGNDVILRRLTGPTSHSTAGSEYALGKSLLSWRCLTPFWDCCSLPEHEKIEPPGLGKEITYQPMLVLSSADGFNVELDRRQKAEVHLTLSIQESANFFCLCSMSQALWLKARYWTVVHRGDTSERHPSLDDLG